MVVLFCKRFPQLYEMSLLVREMNDPVRATHLLTVLL